MMGVYWEDSQGLVSKNILYINLGIIWLALHQ